MPLATSLPLELSPDRPAPLHPAVLADIAERVARAESLWRPNAHHDPVGRRPVRLLATDAYEVWVIGWTPGQGVELHDHGDAAGALVVLEGELAELELDTASGALTRTSLRPGAVHALPVGMVHDIVAVRAEPATSIHVYSPPLTAMRRWDPVTLTPAEPEGVIVEAPVLPAATATRLLHPSSRG